MGNSESYKEDPDKYLVGVLEACRWEPSPNGYWVKGRSCLYVDEVGVFLYRYLEEIGVYVDGMGTVLHQQHKKKWVRTHGLAYAYIQNLPELYIKFIDGSRLDLLTGEPLRRMNPSRVIPTGAQ